MHLFFCWAQSSVNVLRDATDCVGLVRYFLFFIWWEIRLYIVGYVYPPIKSVFLSVDSIDPASIAIITAVLTHTRG